MTRRQRIWILLSGAVFFIVGVFGMVSSYLERRGKNRWPSWA